MTATIIEQINNLNDAGTVEFLEHFNQMLAEGVTSDFDEQLASIPSAVRELPQFNSIENLASGETQHNLTEQDSIELAKKILEILEQNAALLPLLDRAWETWNPDNTLGGNSTKLLSVTMSACMLVVVAATEVKIDANGFEIYKPTVPIPALTALVTALGKIIPGSPSK
jgi:uncharacterized protein (UPF0210 family)